MNVLVLSGTNHRFNESAEVIHGFLTEADDLDVKMEDDKDIFIRIRWIHLMCWFLARDSGDLKNKPMGRASGCPI